MFYKKYLMILKEKFLIKQITAQETYAVRHPVLRTGKPIESCVFSGDNLDTTIHLGLYYERKLIGVVSFMSGSTSFFKEPYQYQLRGMALLKKFQNKALGALLTGYGERVLREQKASLIWCNARKKAVNFYRRNGFKTIGEPFDIPEIGTHCTMYKHL